MAAVATTPSTEVRREEVAVLVWQGAAELCLELAGVDQLVEGLVELLALHFEFQDRQRVHHLLSELIDDLHDEAGIDDVELVEPALEEILQRLRHRLYQLLGDLQQPHVLEVDHRHPVLHLPRDQTTRDDELDHVGTHAHEGVRVGLYLLELLDVHVEDGAEAAVATVHIGVALVQLLLEQLVLGGCDGVGEGESMVDHEAVIGLLESPLRTFQEPLYQAALIIEARRQHYPVLLQILSKAIKCGLLLWCEFGAGMKDHPLTLPLALHHHVFRLRLEVERLYTS